MSVIDTASIGNRSAGQSHVFVSDTAHATFFGVCWDGDKVRGLRLAMSDGTSSQVGGYGDSGYTVTTFTFNSGETLKTAFLRDSGYGYGSLRQVQFTTSEGRSFYAGAGGFDHEVSLAVEGSFIAGFEAWVNGDNFINALLFKIHIPPPAPPSNPVPWFETAVIGNQGAAHSQVSFASNTSTARYLAVRWDGDKVRGISLTLKDGTTREAGGFGDDQYALTSYNFSEGENLVSLNLSTGGYGYQSLRQFSFKTSTGGSFAAGPGGIDDLLQPPVAGSRICGFHAWVNVDNFINAFAFRLTNTAPFVVDFHDFSAFGCTYRNGEILANGRPVVSVAEEQGPNKHGLASPYQRVLQISPVVSGGFCSFDGAATLKISVFGDGTFEAHFGKDGSGSAKGTIAGVPLVTDELVLTEALVRKYAPIQMLNVDEVYWQTTIDEFLPHMIIETVAPGSQTPKPFWTGPLNRQVLARQAIDLGDRNTNQTACLRTIADLNRPSDTQDWMAGTRAAPNGVTSYAVVAKGEGGFLDITYWWLFNYNQGKTVASTSWGNHVSDWEHARVSLSGVNFSHPGSEKIYKVMLAAHDATPVFPPNQCEFYGSQVLAHLANGDHEIYPHAGTYDRPQGTHDYCKTNPYEFDQRLGHIEIYQWDEKTQNFVDPPSGAPAAYKDPSWARYRGRWGNWERGSLFGLVAELESGPEGIFRPSEYPTPAA